MAEERKVFAPAAFTKAQRQKQHDQFRQKIKAAGWIIKEYFDGGITKSSYFIIEPDTSVQQGKLPSPVSGPLKAVMVFGAIAILAAFFSSLEQQSVQKDDKALFTAFYSELMTKTGEVDRTCQPFVEALEKGDLVGATQVALKIKTPITLQWGEISMIEIPDLQNKDAKEKLEKAREVISGAYISKVSVVKDFIDFSESQNVKKMAEIKNSVESMQTLQIGGAAYLAEVARMVGVDITNVRK